MFKIYVNNIQKKQLHFRLISLPPLFYLIRAEAHNQEVFATAQSRAAVDYIF